MFKTILFCAAIALSFALSVWIASYGKDVCTGTPNTLQECMSR